MTEAYASRPYEIGLMTEEQSGTKAIRQLKGGQITIPVEFQRRLGIEDDALLQISLSDGELRIKPLGATSPADQADWFRRLYDYFAPVREEAMERRYTDEEINAAIDEAVKAVRRRHA